MTAAVAQEPPQALADHLMAKAGVPAGICVLLRSSDSALAVALAKSKKAKMWVYAQDARPDKVAATQKAADAEGLLGKRIFVGKSALGAVPFPDHYVDLLLIADLTDADLAGLSATELLRALTPGGRIVIGHTSVRGRMPLTLKALTDWLNREKPADVKLTVDDFGHWIEMTKPLPSGIDDWAHWFHAPDNNPVSTDKVLKWPYLTQWMDKPYFGAQPRTVLVSGGRLITATGSATGADPADGHLLQSRNVYNGALLWTRKLDVNFPASRSMMVATPTTLYLIDEKDVLCLDPDTGQEQKRIEFDGVDGHLKWIAIVDAPSTGSGRGKLLAMAGKPDVTWDKAVFGLKYKYPVPPLSRDLKQETWGFGNEVAALDLATDKVLWVHKEPDSIDGRKIGALDGRVFFIAERTRAVCLDAATGKLVWKNDTKEFRDAATAVKPSFLTKRGNSLGETRPAMLCTSEVITVLTMSMANMVALSPEDGKLLWVQPVVKRNGIGQHTSWIDGKLYTREAQLDLLSGKKAGPGTGGSGCGPTTISPSGMYGRHSIFFDRLRNESVLDHGYRSACWQGGIPAHGMLISAPYTCACNYEISGFITLAPAGDFAFGAKAVEAERLDADPNATPTSKLSADALDWPTYRANARRSGATKAVVPATGKLLWEQNPRVGFEPTAPVAAGDMVALAGDDGRVLCLDAADGGARWTAWTGGRVFAAPTFADGRVFVGSSDGYVYALDPFNGRQLWRFRAAPVPRYTRTYGYLMSTWPVNSGVLVEDGTAYAAAGIVDRDGTHVYALDAATGRIKWQKNEIGHLDKENHKGVSVMGFLAAGDGRLWLPSGKAGLPMSFDLKTGKTAPWSRVGGGRYSEIGLFGDYIIFGGRMLYSDQAFRRMDKGMEQLFVQHEDGRVLFPEVQLNASDVLPAAWDDASFLTAMRHARTLELWDAAQVKALLAKTIKECAPPKKAYIRHRAAQPRKSKTLQDYAMRTWRDEKVELYGVALAANAAVALCGDGNRMEYVPRPSKNWHVKVRDRATGKLLWEQKLPSVPLLNGLCITRKGSVIVTLADGSVLAFGVQ
jgi:outer membrane protein assembly factor BamB